MFLRNGIDKMIALAAWAVVASMSLTGGAPPTVIPAYARNDYHNDRPLFGALELGFRGVEVDYFLIDGELRVGHERGETRPGMTVESLYLAPLRDLVKQYGWVLSGGEVFILNIESKLAGRETYDALHELLAGYEDILTVVRGGVEHPGAVQVVLVGWHPPLDSLACQPVRYAAVQAHYSDLPPDHEKYPAHLLRLLSQNYKDKLLTRGGGAVSRRLRQRLESLAGAARAVPGRLVRVYDVPTRGDVYRALLESGVDLLGTKDIVGAHRLLTEQTSR
jgi:hypothetical protein